MPSTTSPPRKSVPDPIRQPSHNAEANVITARVPWHPWVRTSVLVNTTVSSLSSNVYRRSQLKQHYIEWPDATFSRGNYNVPTPPSEFRNTRTAILSSTFSNETVLVSTRG